MPINPQRVARYLEVSLLQLGAESYLHDVDFAQQDQVVTAWKFGFNDPTHPFIQREASNAGADAPRLPGSNRMEENQARNLFARYEIVDHHANDATGLTATLYRNRVTGEYTLSFRSTEARPWKVAGDAERDEDGAGKVGIYERGFAFAQLASMEDYWGHIRAGERWDKDANGGKGAWVADQADGKLAAFRDDLDSGKALYTTGYSLAGHLATVFTLMHEAEVTETYTFNAAGHGILTDRAATSSERAGGTTGAAVKEMLNEFTRTLQAPAIITDDYLETVLPGELYAETRQWLVVLRDQAVARKSLDAAFDPFASESGRIDSTLSPRGDIYSNPRYEFAVQYATALHPTKSLADDPIRALFRIGPFDILGALLGNADFQAFGTAIEEGRGSEPVSGSGYDKIVSISGRATHDDFLGVADSQRHTANRIQVFIEDQPDIFGKGGLLPLNNRAEVVDEIIANQDGGPGDYATTHALVLIIDSLSLAAKIQEIAPGLDLETIAGMMAASSKMRGESSFALNGSARSNPGYAEGDSLENLLDALRRVFKPDADVTPYDRLNVGFGDFSNRTQYYANLSELGALAQGRVVSIESLVLAPATTTIPEIAAAATVRSGITIVATELNAAGLAHRYALKRLNPFVVIGESLYADWNADGDLDLYDAANGTGALTPQWIDDRAEMLRRKLVLNLNNLNSDVNNAATVAADGSNINTKNNTSAAADPRTSAATESFREENIVYDDRETGYRIDFGVQGDKRRVVFGSDMSLHRAGADMLAGGVIGDRLYGGSGVDLLVGGKGDDRMEGGRGFDSYRLFSTDGQDTVFDADGKGLLVRDGVAFALGIKEADDAWKLGGLTYTRAANGTDLEITFADEPSDKITVENFDFAEAQSSSYLGIRLWDGLNTPAIARTLVGDLQPRDSDPAPGLQLQYDSWGNVLTSEQLQARDDALFGGDDASGDFIRGLDGNDVLFGDTAQLAFPGERTNLTSAAIGGADYIQGGAGRDFIHAGPGDDLVEGGSDGMANGDAGGDVIDGGPGNDEIYGDEKLDLSDAIAQGEQAVAAGQKGDFLSGGAGDDWIVGGAGHNVLAGGAGRDLLIGGPGNDDIWGDRELGAGIGWSVVRSVTVEAGVPSFFSDYTGVVRRSDGTVGDADVIYGGAGDDWIASEAGDDFVDAGSGDDVVYGMSGSDILFGGSGEDWLFGDSALAAPDDGADYLDGGSGRDALYGGGGDDILIGGTGDDVLVGGAGKDTYFFSAGDGRDEIIDASTGAEASILVFGEGFDPNSVTLRPGSMELDFGSAGSVVLRSFDHLDANSPAPFQHLVFADGTELGYAQVIARGFDIDGTSGADVLIGTAFNDRIRGRAGNDTIFGGAGNDYLEGGEGFDTLEGGAGDDTYVYDTFDTVIDSQGQNRILFAEGIVPESLNINTFTVSGQPRLLIERLGTTGPGLEILGVSLTSSNFVYDFADGRTFSHAELLQAAYFVRQFISGTPGDDVLVGFAGNDIISGASGDDTISGGAGDDILSGQAGNDTLWGGSGTDYLGGGEGADTYLFGYGDGNDTVSELGTDAGVDTVRLRDGISLSDVTLKHEPNGDLTITLKATEERLTLPGWYAGGPRVEEIAFGDGVVIGEAAIAGISIMPISGTAGDDILRGTRYEDTLLGFGGDDVLDGGPNGAPSGYLQSNDLLLGGEGHDTYVLGWRNARDTVIEEPGETSTIRLVPGMTLDDVAARREGDDLFVHGRRTEHGLLLKNYYVQAHDWHIETALGVSMSMPEFLARPAPTTGDRVRDLWEARKTQFKHEWYAIDRGELQEDGTFYQAPSDTVSLSFGRTYYNGDWAGGTGGLQAEPIYGSESTTSFGAGNVVSSNAGFQHYRLGNEQRMTTLAPASYSIDWDSPVISRTTTYLGTYIGFDLLIHSLYRTHASVRLFGAVEGITLDAADGASGPELVAAVAGGALPRTVNGVFNSTTGSFRPVEILGGPSNNVIALTDFGMVDGGAGNDIIDAVGGGWFSHPAGGNFLYGGAGDDGITGSGDGDLISGGPGDDRLAGYAGDDTFYFFAADAGIDVVNEVTWYLWDTYDGVVSATALYNADSGRESEDTVEFGEGISLDGLTLSWGTYDSRYAWWSRIPLKTYDTLDIYWGPDRGVQVMLPDRFDAEVRKDMTIHSPGSSWGIEHFKFADGTTLSFQDMVDRIPTQVLNGTAGDDFLVGSAGSNEFFGGGGIDWLYGAFASDTYYFNLGDGEDWIRDPGGTDRIVFGAGITPEMLSLGLGSMLVRIGTGGDALHIEYFDPEDPFRTGAIETYEFAGGSTLTHAQLLERGFDVYGSDAGETLAGTGITDRMYGLGGDDTLTGGGGSDLLDGGPGNDLLAGGEGSDTYRFDFGTGFDTVVETDAQGDDADIVLLGPGITGEDLTVARAGADMVLTLAGGSDRLTISNWFTAPGYRIERVEFAHGSTWDAAMLEWLALLSNRTPLATVEIDDQTAYEDAYFSFAVPGDTFADPDVGDELTYTALQADGTPLPEWLAFDSATRSFSGKPAQSDVGSVDVRVVAADLWGASAQDIFELTVLNTNDAPVLTHAIPDQVARAGAPFNFTLAADTFADQDPGDMLSLSAVRLGASPPPLPPLPPPLGFPPPPGADSHLPAWLQFDASTQGFSGTPSNDDVGTLEIRVTATDGSGASVSDVFVITVASGNSPPVVANPIPDQEATEDAPFSFTVPSNAITDPDAGDILTWSAEGSNGEPLPGWLTFDAVNRVFTGTPTNDDVGAFGVRLTATDSLETSASDVFTITVANTNDAPTLEQPIGDQSATEDEFFRLDLPPGMFADIDTGDTLTLSATLPDWLTLEGSVLSGTPVNADVGEFDVRVTATDSAGARASDEFRLTVLNVNDAPIVASPIADQSFEAGAVSTFTVPAATFFDEDAGDSLSYAASVFGGGALPAWLTFDALTATFTGRPVTGHIGISHIAVSATDMSGASAISDFSFIVRAPAGAKVRGDAAGNLIYGGTGDETLVGGAGDDMLFGDIGDDVLRGGRGTDVLQGGDGADVLHGGNDNNVLDGGSGDDVIFDGAGDSFISGGTGNDTLRLGRGNDVIAFNSGDGWDTIIGGGDGGNTLSFGGGIRYSDLSFSRAGDDLIVSTGQNEGIVLDDWYAGTRSVLNLQIILDATDEFDASSSDPLYNRRVQTFNFLGLVSAFDQARTASLTSWALTNALLQWQLWGADDAALGGDLAYWYGRNRTLAGISLQAAQQVIGASGFGSDAHSLRPFSGLQEGFAKLA